MPHYWPADHVPYLPVTYCELFQGLFAALFLSCLGYIVFGLKWYFCSLFKYRSLLSLKGWNIVLESAFEIMKFQKELQNLFEFIGWGNGLLLVIEDVESIEELLLIKLLLVFLTVQSLYFLLFLFTSGLYIELLLVLIRIDFVLFCWLGEIRILKGEFIIFR